jgi:hypothetical protein
MTTRHAQRLFALLPLLLVSACATVSAGADSSPGVRFDQYRTYSWDERDGLPVGDPRLDNNPFFDSRVRAAVELELAAKGLRQVSGAPDLLIHYHASVQRRVDVLKSDRDLGYVSMENSQTTSVVEFDEGTLLLDVADAKGKQILWRGWAQSDVSGLLERPRDMEKRISQSVRRMIKNFPRTP